MPEMARELNAFKNVFYTNQLHCFVSTYTPNSFVNYVLNLFKTHMTSLCTFCNVVRPFIENV